MNSQRESQTVSDPPIARVYNQYLYRSDLENLTKDTTNSEFIEQYIESWLFKQLMIAEAEAHSKYNKADIERRVLDYRYALLVHGFIEELVNVQLDRKVLDEEIKTYYQTHQKDFLLRHNIFRGRFIIIPKNAPHRAKLSELLNAKNEKKIVELNSYCAQFAKNYSLNPIAWLQWDEVIKNTPLSNFSNKAQLLKKSKLLQTSDDTYYYYFKIDAYRMVNDVSPLEFVSKQVADIIIYKRKIALANKIKEDFLQKAKKNNHCVIYEH